MKQRILKVLAVLFAALFAVSCSDVGSASISGNYDDKCVVDLSAQVLDEEGALRDIEEAMQEDRTLLPDPTSHTGLTFKLTGKGNMGSIVSDGTNNYQEVTFDSDKKGKVKLGYEVWELVLTAYKGTDPVLIGYTTADFTAGGNDLEFVLSKGNLTTAGSISVTGSYTDGTVSDADKVKTIVWTLRDFTTDADVDTQTSSSPAAAGTTYSKTGLTPGKYYLFAKFQNSGGATIGNWGDLVVVDPGLETTGTFGPIDLNTVPTAPSNIKVWSVDASRAKDSYTAKITWDDNSSDEEQFLIKITEYSDTSFAGSYTALDQYFLYMEELPTGKTTLYTDPRKKSSGTQSDIYVSGSLLAGNKEFCLTLPTGRLFDVEVAAKNDIGVSAYGVRVNSDDDTTNGLTGYKADKKVNLHYIDYNTVGGKLSTALDTSYSSDYVVYSGYDGTQKTLLAINSSVTTPVTYPTCVRNGNDWNQWVTVRNGTTKIEKDNGYNNLTVFADYNPQVVISYLIDGYTDIADSRVTMGYATTSTGDVVSGVDLKNGQVELDGTTVPTVIYIRTTVTAANADDSRTYTEYKFYLDTDTLYQAGPDDKCQICSSELSSGVHRMTVMAKVANTTDWYSKTFAFTIKR